MTWWPWRGRQQRQQDDEDMSGENRLMLRAIDMRMRRALRPGKAIIGVLAAVIVGLAFVAGQLEYYHFTHPTTNALVANSIKNCQGNNAYRVDQTGIWQAYLAFQAQESKDTGKQLTALISVLANGNPAEIAQIRAILKTSGAVNTADQNAFILKVMAVNQPRNCVAANQVTGH